MSSIVSSKIPADRGSFVLEGSGPNLYTLSACGAYSRYEYGPCHKFLHWDTDTKDSSLRQACSASRVQAWNPRMLLDSRSHLLRLLFRTIILRRTWITEVPARRPRDDLRQAFADERVSNTRSMDGVCCQGANPVGVSGFETNLPDGSH